MIAPVQSLVMPSPVSVQTSALGCRCRSTRRSSRAGTRTVRRRCPRRPRSSVEAMIGGVGDSMSGVTMLTAATEQYSVATSQRFEWAARKSRHRRPRRPPRHRSRRLAVPRRPAERGCRRLATRLRPRPRAPSLLEGSGTCRRCRSPVAVASPAVIPGERGRPVGPTACGRCKPHRRDEPRVRTTPQKIIAHSGRGPRTFAGQPPPV